MRLKELREEKGLSQTELGKILGYSQNAISQWELQKTEPKHKDLIAVADFFDVSIDYLLGRTDDILFRDTTISAKAQREITLINNFRKLNKDKQNRVLGYIDSMLKDTDINFEISDNTYEQILQEAQQQGIKDRELLMKKIKEKSG